MSNEIQFDSDSLKIGDNQKVRGTVLIGNVGGGYDIIGSVFSYEYERRGTTKMNHVPNVVITDKSGSIIREPSARDSENPVTAISNTKETVKHVAENIEEFVNNE